MLDRLFHALIRTENQAADDLLLQALRLGNEAEQARILDALLERKSPRGLAGLIGAFDGLSDALQEQVLRNVRFLHHALAECGRSRDPQLRLAAMKLIALGRQGKLAYVLSENLHETNDALPKAAADALVALARWIATETRRLQRGIPPRAADASLEGDARDDAAKVYQLILEQRPEIEAAVARAVNLHRGKQGTELLRAALLLADWPQSRTLAILQTSKHGAQNSMVRRLQQPPDSEHVDAFLLGATHGHLRSSFAVTFSHIEQAPVLEALLRRTHWLKDAQLQSCMHAVTRGAWWNPGELAREIDRRPAEEASRIAEWLSASGLHDVELDDRYAALLERLGDGADSVAGRLRVLRITLRRKRGSSVGILKTLISDPDERIARMAAREMIRRRPPDYENILLKQMTQAPPSVRLLIGRSIGQAGFEQFWQRFDRIDRKTRQSAGRAMFKLLPDAPERLYRRATTGPAEQRVKALQIAHELGATGQLGPAIVRLCEDPNPHVRSKAVAVLANIPDLPSEMLVERLLKDPDPRVRANAIEVLEARKDPQFVPLLAERARSASGRERANAIRAMHRMRISTAGTQLTAMLRDGRAEHRISAMWALRQIGFWRILNEVVTLARTDTDLRVRRYALTLLKNVAELAKEQRKAG